MSDRDWGWFQKGKDRKKSERMPKDGLYPKRYRAYSKGAWFIEMAYGSVMLLLPWYMRYFLYLPVFPTALAVGLFYLMIGISEQCVHQFAPYTSVTGLGRRVPWYILGNLICMIGFVALWIYPPSVNERDFQGYFFTPV
jgi:Na+/melibiose symporter-like transporter